MAPIEEASLDVDGVRVFCRRRDGDGPPAVFVHGNPTHSGDWTPFMERMRGAALALDLPGFGRSGRPEPDEFDYSMHGFGRFVARALEIAGIGEHSLVIHDWGSVALLAAQRQPERVRRLVVINAVPLFGGYRWHPVARLWRTPGVGELVNASLTKPGVRLGFRFARPRLRAMPSGWVEDRWPFWDRGMKRAILRLYRSADPAVLEAAGLRLAALDCPALVVWGERDPYLGTALARGYAERLPGAELAIVPAAGHWPWLDRPELIARVVDFLEPS